MVVKVCRLAATALAAVFLGLLLAASAAGAELIVSVAASMTDVAQELKPLFEEAHPGVKVLFNFGSSGALQRQIEHGAPVDVFLSAAIEPVERLLKQGHVVPGSVRYVAGNRLVLIRPAAGAASSVDGWTSLADRAVRSVAIGNPHHVPAGIYGREALEALGLWEAILPKLVFAEDVRQVLHYVRTGAVDAGVVYATDAATSTGVQVVAEAPAGSHGPVIYPVARVQGSRHPQLADAFIAFLFTQEAREILARYGFSPVEGHESFPAGSP